MLIQACFHPLRLLSLLLLPSSTLCNKKVVYKIGPNDRNMRIRSRNRKRHDFDGGTYAAGWCQGAIDVEEDNGVLDWAGLERRVDGSCFGHGCGLC